MAFLTTVCIFAYFVICGRAWLSAFRVNLGNARNWLLAPTLGVSLVVLCILILNQAGLPVQSFARPLFAGLLVLALGIAAWRRDWRLRGIAPFAVLALLALAVGGWPMLRYGFNWVSYGNDDMTNYCLSAQRMMHDGFYRIPKIEELSGRDYSQFYWFAYAPRLLRAGSELLLAGVASVIGRTPMEAFMPSIFALAMLQLWALGALLYSCPRRRTHALVSVGFVAISPLWTYGTLHQLIAQVGGIALLLATLTLTARHRFAVGYANQARQAAIISLPVAGISIFYPEVIPFFVLSLLIYTGHLLFRTRRLVSGQLAVAFLSALMVVLMLRYNVFSTFTTLLGQAAGGLSPEDIRLTIFPYFLMPRGLSVLFGLEAITRSWGETMSSVCIGISLGALLIVLFMGLRHRAQPSAGLFLVMAAIGGKLFLGNNGFGLFKLAMFITPVLVAEITRLFVGRRSRHLGAGVSLLLGSVWLIVTQQYVRSSMPSSENIFLEINDASVSRGQMPAGPTTLLSDITSSPVAKLAAAGQGNTPIIFLSRPFMKGIMEIRSYVPPEWVWRFMPHPEIPERAAELSKAVYANLFIPQKAFGTVIWTPPIQSTQEASVLFTSRAEFLSYNKLCPVTIPEEGLYGQTPLTSLHNHLSFIHSEAGQHYYLGDAGQIAVYKPQSDVYSTLGTFFAIGRKLVFQVINPSATVRLRLSLTNSILGFGRTRLPNKAIALGGNSAPAKFDIEGSGSANVYSAPLQPLSLGGRSYVALDLARIPEHFSPGELHGLNALYNREVLLDPRLMNGYCRDISLISEAEYEQMSRPTTLDKFPHDLVEQPGLEYSGLYEDGWVSKDAFVILGEGSPGHRLTVKGMVPLLPDDTLPDNTVEVQLNGKHVETVLLRQGNFELKYPLDTAVDSLRVDLHFSREGRLPSTDQRPVAALLTSITFQREN